MQLLFLSSDEGITTVNLRKGAVTALVIGIFALLAVVFGLVVVYLVPVIHEAQIDRMTGNNERLIHEITDLQNRALRIKRHLQDFENRDEAIRVYLEAPQLSSDIRDLGVGGTRYAGTEEYDNLIPGDSVKFSALFREINHLERSIRFQKLSYNSLLSAAETKSGEMENTPSIRPVDVGYFTDFFGYRRDPFTGKRRFHYGLDISAPSGTPVYATAPGRVKYARRRGGYGKMIGLQHENNYETGYAHLSTIIVRPGQQVKRGEVIGEVGNTGRSTASHLHYEVIRNGQPQRPVEYFFSGYLD